MPAIATIWQEQMAEIGVEVEIQMVPSDVYYGSENMCGSGLCHHRLGLPLLPAALFGPGLCHRRAVERSHWSDPELDELAAAAAKMDHEAVQLTISSGSSWSAAVIILLY